ncbi:MAG: hypothetical protein Kow0075_06770 [Salibacteraceae bacterium]
MGFWKRVVRDYFTFNRSERRAIRFLTIVLLALFAAHITLKFLPGQHTTFSIEQLAVELEENKTHKSEKDASPVDSDGVSWVPFDPNRANPELLIGLGLDSHVALRWVKYLNRGGRFKDVDDVAKLYGIDTSWLMSARQYMAISSDETKTRQTGDRLAGEVEKDTQNFYSVFPNSVNLNLADSTELVKIPWVGPYYASQIIKLRESLGGFCSYEQLLDIFNMREETMETIFHYTFLDSAAIRSIDLNQASIPELAKHKYITWKQARVIVNYRIQHGPYTSVKQLTNTRVISDSLLLKLKPYLKIDSGAK